PAAHRLQRRVFTTILPEAMIITLLQRHRGGFQPVDAVSFYAPFWRCRRQAPKTSPLVTRIIVRSNTMRAGGLMPRSARSTILV
ncbi:MAG: hypothetical protein J0H80_00380, partial [Rhizobiales bacterium]|nr:hypothetical protein [Hyphomicrobiales bacterium]